jgi:sugar O-acyltransferase (sialic acid O-acetyltransferase NeuD family)
MTKRIILVGGGALAREIINVFNNTYPSKSSNFFKFYIDQEDTFLEDKVYQLNYLGKINEYKPEPQDLFVLAIANPEIKQKVVKELKAKGAFFESLIHPSSFVAKTAKLGEGIVIFPMSAVSADATILSFVTINFLSTIGHDVEIGEYTTLSAHVDLTGKVLVESKCFFGTGAKVLPDITIGSSSIIGAGSIIYRNVAPNSTMYTQPAKKL